MLLEKSREIKKKIEEVLIQIQILDVEKDYRQVYQLNCIYSKVNTLQRKVLDLSLTNFYIRHYMLYYIYKTFKCIKICFDQDAQFNSSIPD